LSLSHTHTHTHILQIKHPGSQEGYHFNSSIIQDLNNKMCLFLVPKCLTIF